MKAGLSANRVILTLWLGTTAAGFLAAGWLGALTGLVCYTTLVELVLFALGRSRLRRPVDTPAGRIQQLVAWPFVASAVAGTWYGGWRWGWLWCLLFYAPLAIVTAFGGAALNRRAMRAGRARVLQDLAA